MTNLLVECSPSILQFHSMPTCTHTRAPELSRDMASIPRIIRAGSRSRLVHGPVTKRHDFLPRLLLIRYLSLSHVGVLTSEMQTSADSFACPSLGLVHSARRHRPGCRLLSCDDHFSTSIRGSTRAGRSEGPPGSSQAGR